MPKLEFLFDANLVASIRIKADGLSAAKRNLSKLLDCASANLGPDSDGNPGPDFGLTFVSVDDSERGIHRLLATTWNRHPPRLAWKLALG